MPRRWRAIYRLNRMRYKSWRKRVQVASPETLRSGARAFFHWRYSGVFIPVWFGGGLGAVFANQFFPAYGFFSVMGLWTIGYWLFSDVLERQNGKVQKLKRKANREKATAQNKFEYRDADRKFVILKFGVLLLLILITGSCLYWTYSKEWEHELGKLDGWLVPGDDDVKPDCLPSHTPFHINVDSSVPENAVSVFLGDSRFVTPTFPYSPLMYNAKPVLTMDRDDAGRIGITVDIRSRDGKIVARFDKGHFQINANNILSMKRPDKSTLIVEDQDGTEVLNIRYRNRQVIHFLGTLNVEGRSMPVKITEDGVRDGVLIRARLCENYVPPYKPPSLQISKLP